MGLSPIADVGSGDGDPGGRNAAPAVLDVIVIGAGVAGSCAACALAEAGYSVALIDSTARIPPTLRAEKLGSEAADLFARLGLGHVFDAVATPIYSIWVARFGRVMARQFKREYGFAYDGLVERLRAALPASVDLRIARIAAIARSPETQQVVLSDGSALAARLLVVATGQGDAVKRKLGIDTTLASGEHSMCIGFYMDRPRSSFPFESLVYYGERRSDRVAYFSLFPIGARMRANLFVYRSHAEAWTASFRAAPDRTLRETLPRLEAVAGPIGVEGGVTVRPIDLTRARGHEGDGVVLIGDAFCTACPITGTGLRKALVDVERLVSRHVPAWFATPGMGAEKIAQFYADPVKTRFDAGSLNASHLLRGLTVGAWRDWAPRRLRRGLKTRVSFGIHRVADKAAMVVSALLAVI